MVMSNTNPMKKRTIVICACAAAALVLVAAAVMGYVVFFADDGLILPNVTIAGMDLGGKTQEEARVLVQRQTDLTYPYEDMVVRFPDEDLRLSPADTGVKLDVDRIIADAYSYGRSGTWAENRATREVAESTSLELKLADYLSLDTAYIQSRLDEYQTAHTSDYLASGVVVEGERPALDAENYDPEAPCQVLVITIGNPGRSVDMEGILEKVIAAYGANEFLVTADVPSQELLPAPIELEPVYEEHFAEAVDAVVDKNSHDVVPETYGYDFDLEAAQAMLEEAQYGDVLEIPFRYIEPDMVAEDLKDRHLFEFFTLGAC